MVAILFMLLLAVVLGLAAARMRTAAREAQMLRAMGGDASASRRLERRERRRARRERRDAYLDAFPFVNLYQLVIIFTVASIGGLLLETIWVRIDMGIWQRRYGMVWGPFSPLYGLGAVILTLALWKIRKQPSWMVFIVSMLLGSCVEQFAGVVMESGFNATSWTYEEWPDAITKYVCLRMGMAWGLLGVVWCKVALPELLFSIGEPKPALRAVVTVALTSFLVIDGLMTLCVAARKDARDQGIPPANAFEYHIDEYYDDRFFQERFENLEFDAAEELR